jgi:50S ribosomal protein L16 3-hydroxylase
VERFLGEYLSEPKAHVVFAPGATPRALARSMVRLDPKTRLLYRGRRFFINGESFSVRGRVRGLRELADRRVAEGRRLAGVRLHGLISQWARLGYAHLEKA